MCTLAINTKNRVADSLQNQGFPADFFAQNRQVWTVVLCLPPVIQLQSRIQARTVVELFLQLTGFKTRAGDP